MRRAFTLVELLVVIGVLAVLMALLMPSLRLAREQAQRTLCANRLRQLTAAAVSYGNENRGRLPPGNRSAGDLGESCIWISHDAYNYFAGYVGAPLPTKPRGKNGTGAAALACPNLFGNDAHTLPVDAPSGIGWVIGYNYIGNHKMAETNNKWPTASPVRLSDSGALALFADLNDWSPIDHFSIVPHQRRAGGGFFEGAEGGKAPPAYGAAGGNVAFLDGSVRWKLLGPRVNGIQCGEMQAHRTVSYPTMPVNDVDIALW
jgi:prepilin-type N-terminal cleavage/methylation domain-containing protein/prepilin-type processing-associated H-X9-DG protein